MYWGQNPISDKAENNLNSWETISTPWYGLRTVFWVLMFPDLNIPPFGTKLIKGYLKLPVDFPEDFLDSWLL